MRRSNSARCCGSSAARRLCQASRAGAAALAGGAPLREDRRRNLEGRRAPAELFARAPRSRRRRAASRGSSRCRLGRRAEADGGAAGDQRRPVGLFGRFDRGGDRRGIVAVDAGRRPAGGLEALHLIDGVGERQRAVDRDAVVVEQHDELVQLQMPGERDRFLADALHQVAVGGEHVGRVIDDVVAEQRGEVALGDRHADGIGKPLAERTGRGLDAGRVAVFGMAGRERAELAEALDLADRHRLVAERDRAARRSASSRGRPRARSGRGRARPDRPDRI